MKQAFKGTLFASILFLFFITKAQTVIEKSAVSKVWVADNGDGTYKNPVLNADYSDPDAIRVGDDYYLVASSFDAIPGLPILHSKDLVNWTIIGHALHRQPPYEHFSQTQHGNGVWAPAIRYHNNEFYIYYPDPDFGIYVVKTKNIKGPWSEPVLIESGKGLIDPCPLWDDNGKLYLVHAYAGSRATIKSIAVIKELNADGTKVISDPILVFDGHEHHPTLEGPKLYKRNGYYYIFAPAGGVGGGYQLILRSKNIYGPYEEKVVLDQGTTTVNGPHQGAWVTTQTGEDWFLHFQDKGPYGRVVHLQPMQWKNNWPVMGIDKNGDGKGEPVLTFKKPNVGKKYPVMTPQESDEFNTLKLGLQWQWQANPKEIWAMLRPEGFLRMNAIKVADTAKNYWDVPAVLLQKFPNDEFSAVAKVNFQPKFEGDKFGLIVMGMSYAYISLVKKADGVYVSYSTCKDAIKGKAETTEKLAEKINSSTVYLKLIVTKTAICKFSYSLDGVVFKNIDEPFKAVEGRWVGAKMGMFCSTNALTNDSGFADVDWFRVDKN